MLSLANIMIKKEKVWLFADHKQGTAIKNTKYGHYESYLSLQISVFTIIFLRELSLIFNRIKKLRLTELKRSTQVVQLFSL